MRPSLATPMTRYLVIFSGLILLFGLAQPARARWAARSPR